jgi:hypothetical protein
MVKQCSLTFIDLELPLPFGVLGIAARVKDLTNNVEPKTDLRGWVIYLSLPAGVSKYWTKIEGSPGSLGSCSSQARMLPNPIEVADD